MADYDDKTNPVSGKTGLRALQAAVIDDKLETVRALVEKGASIFERGECRKPSHRWEWDIEWQLLPERSETTAEIKNLHDDWNVSPLRLAHRDPDGDIYRWIRDHVTATLSGGNEYAANAMKNKLGDELADALDRKDEAYAATLLALGADPANASSSYGSALMKALERKNHDLLEDLVKSGHVDPARVTLGSGKLLHHLAANNDVKGLDIVLGRYPGLVDQAAGEDDPATPLLTAVRRGSIDAARALLKHGADAAAHDKQGKNALTLCLAASGGKDGQKAFLAALLERAPELPAIPGLPDGESVFHMLARRGNKDDFALFEELARNLPDAKILDTVNADGKTPLFLAAVEGPDAAKKGNKGVYDADKHCHLRLVDLMIDAGANPNVGDAYGWTPLDCLSERNDDSSPMVKRLITGGGIYKKQLPKDFNAAAEIRRAQGDSRDITVEKRKPARKMKPGSQ